MLMDANASIKKENYIRFSFSSKFEISKPQICSEFYSQPDCRMSNGMTNNESGHSVSKARTHPFTVTVVGNNTFSIGLQVGTSPYSRFNLRFSPNQEDYEVRLSSSFYFHQSKQGYNHSHSFNILQLFHSSLISEFMFVGCFSHKVL